MHRSESVVNLVTALSKAQAAMENPKFDATNPHFKSRYCSLAAIRDAILPPLTAQGLSVLQPIERAGDVLSCETTIYHESGEWLSTLLTLELPEKWTVQTFAALSTYAKRISLQALVCVAGDEDDDGAAAVTATQKQTRDAVDTYTYEGLVERIDGVFEDVGLTTEAKARWWIDTHKRHGNPVPIGVMRHLYRRVLERQKETSARESPPAPEDDTARRWQEEEAASSEVELF